MLQNNTTQSLPVRVFEYHPQTGAPGDRFTAVLDRSYEINDLNLVLGVGMMILDTLHWTSRGYSSLSATLPRLDEIGWSTKKVPLYLIALNPETKAPAQSWCFGEFMYSDGKAQVTTTTSNPSQNPLITIPDQFSTNINSNQIFQQSQPNFDFSKLIQQSGNDSSQLNLGLHVNNIANITDNITNQGVNFNVNASLNPPHGISNLNQNNFRSEGIDNINMVLNDSFMNNNNQHNHNSMMNNGLFGNFISESMQNQSPFAQHLVMGHNKGMINSSSFLEALCLAPNVDPVTIENQPPKLRMGTYTTHLSTSLLAIDQNTANQVSHPPLTYYNQISSESSHSYQNESSANQDLVFFKNIIEESINSTQRSKENTTKSQTLTAEPQIPTRSSQLNLSNHFFSCNQDSFIKISNDPPSSANLAANKMSMTFTTTDGPINTFAKRHSAIISSKSKLILDSEKSDCNSDTYSSRKKAKTNSSTKSRFKMSRTPISFDLSSEIHASLLSGLADPKLAKIQPKPAIATTSSTPEDKPQILPSGGPFKKLDLYKGVINKAELKLETPVKEMKLNWSEEEMSTQRRLVRFTKKLDSNGSNTLRCQFNPLTQKDYDRMTSEDSTAKYNDAMIISIIHIKGSEGYYITSVDMIKLLGGLLGCLFTLEEKNRIRRNLQHFNPTTITPTSHPELYNTIMAFPAPKPRNITKGLKVFPVDGFESAIRKVIGKHTASQSSTLQVNLMPLQ